MDSHFKEFENPLWDDKGLGCIYARSTNEDFRQFWVPILTVTDQLDVESLQSRKAILKMLSQWPKLKKRNNFTEMASQEIQKIVTENEKSG